MATTNASSLNWKKKYKSALQGGGEKRIEAQHAKGKKTARERIALLLDPDSFVETDQLVTPAFTQSHPHGGASPTDGVVTGFGTVDGKQVALYSQDFTIKGGSLGKHHAQKICKIMDMAVKIGCPIIGIIDSGGARIDEGIHALGGYGEIFMRNTRYSGVVPQLSVILGPCAGGAVYSPALTDFIFTTEKISQLFITGPQVIKEVMHEEITKEALGGTHAHATKSGVVHFVSPTEESCFDSVKKLLSFLPSNYLAEPDSAPSTYWDNQPTTTDTFFPATTTKVPSPGSDTLSTLVPSDQNKGYNIKAVINELTDDFLEVQKDFGPNVVVGFGRITGNTKAPPSVVGIVANQPMVLAGALDINASCKAARFINFCDSFSIPIVSLVDIPGFLPGVEQEHNGIIRHGAKLLAAYAQATTPKITVILRKAFGGAYIVMGSKHLGADFIAAWPSAQIAVLGPKAAVTILHGRELRNIENSNEKAAQRKVLEEDYATTYLNPFVAAEHGYVDAIIEPGETRSFLEKALQITKEKVERLPRKKRGNIPL